MKREREQESTINGLTQTWIERVLLIRSDSYLKKQQRGLQTRLATAKEKLLALTPPVGRGKRQILSGTGTASTSPSYSQNPSGGLSSHVSLSPNLPSFS